MLMFVYIVFSDFHPQIIKHVYTLHTQNTKRNVLRFINNMLNIYSDNYRKHLKVFNVGDHH